jgi:hypothetical protein
MVATQGFKLAVNLARSKIPCPNYQASQGQQPVKTTNTLPARAIGATRKPTTFNHLHSAIERRRVLDQAAAI